MKHLKKFNEANNEDIETLSDMLRKYNSVIYEDTPTSTGVAYDIDDVMAVAYKFAENHVNAALKEAANKATLTDFAYEFLQEGAYDAIDKESILNAYTLNNLK